MNGFYSANFVDHGVIQLIQTNLVYSYSKTTTVQYLVILGRYLSFASRSNKQRFDKDPNKRFHDGQVISIRYALQDAVGIDYRRNYFQEAMK